MWPALLFVCIIWLYVNAVVHWYSFYITLLFTLVYVLYLIDGAWLSGTRGWLQLRVLGVWRYLSPVNYYFPDTPNVFGAESGPRKKYLFLVLPNYTNAALFWGFGMHHGKFAPLLRIRYLLPSILFYIPLLRDLLMWSGAVGYTPGDKWEAVNALLNRGYSVAYACNNAIADKPELEVQVPSEAVFEYATQEGVSIVPVIVNGERERYVFAPQPSFITSIQRYCQARWDYAFPQVYMIRRKPRLHLQFCTTIQPHLYENATELRAEFIRVLKSANNSGADKRINFIE